MPADDATLAPPATAEKSTRLKITEVFCSLQGESSRVGWPTVFVRLTGCPLRCGYCDTAYAFHGGEWRTTPELLQTVQSHHVRHVCVTGGEPLAQKNCLSLLTALCDAGYSVSLETSGAIDIAPVDARVARIVDVKTPGSGEVTRNRWENLTLLKAGDEVKFVLCSREDYLWALGIVAEHRLAERCEVLFSPSHHQLAPRDLADWVVADRPPVRVQVQLHKILWGEKPGT